MTGPEPSEGPLELESEAKSGSERVPFKFRVDTFYHVGRQAEIEDAINGRDYEAAANLIAKCTPLGDGPADLLRQISVERQAYPALVQRMITDHSIEKGYKELGSPETIKGLIEKLRTYEALGDPKELTEKLDRLDDYNGLGQPSDIERKLRETDTVVEALKTLPR